MTSSQLSRAGGHTLTMFEFPPQGELEVRAKGDFKILVGSFPYGRQATVMDRGRVRKERIGPDAFGWQIERFQGLQAEMAQVMEGAVDQARRELLEEQLERANVHVLSGHSFDRPLGDMKRGTARVTSNAERLTFEVDLPDPSDMPSWMADTVKAVRTGRAGGISPGFRVPPKNVVPNAERLDPEPGNPGVAIRTVNQAVLYEVSIVSRPAYGSTAVDVRAEDFGIDEPEPRRRLWL